MPTKKLKNWECEFPLAYLDVTPNPNKVQFDQTGLHAEDVLAQESLGVGRVGTTRHKPFATSGRDHFFLGSGYPTICAGRFACSAHLDAAAIPAIQIVRHWRENRQGAQI